MVACVFHNVRSITNRPYRECLNIFIILGSQSADDCATKRRFIAVKNASSSGSKMRCVFIYFVRSKFFIFCKKQVLIFCKKQTFYLTTKSLQHYRFATKTFDFAPKTSKTSMFCYRQNKIDYITKLFDFVNNFFLRFCAVGSWLGGSGNDRVDCSGSKLHNLFVIVKTG